MRERPFLTVYVLTVTHVTPAAGRNVTANERLPFCPSIPSNAGGSPLHPRVASPVTQKTE